MVSARVTIVGLDCPKEFFIVFTFRWEKIYVVLSQTLIKSYGTLFGTT